MKKLFILFTFCAFFCGCANSQNEQAPKQAAPQTTTAAPAPKNDIRKNRSNVIQNTARPASEINAVFPYDIELKNADGKVVQSSDVMKKDGKPTILLFWLTTCFPCKIEMKAIHEKFPQWSEETDFRLVAISTDFNKNVDAFNKMVKENGWKWETYHDFNREFRSVMPGALNGLPQTFVLDADGEVVYHKRKYSTGDEDKLYAKIKELAMK